MKILHVYKSYYPQVHGGVEHFINQLINANQGTVSDVMSFHRAPEFKQSVDGHQVYSFRPVITLASTPLSLSGLLQFSRHIKDYDLLHYHFPYPFADLLHFLHRPQQKYIITYHTDIVKQKRLVQLYKPLGNWFLQNSQRIVLTSPQYLKSSKFLARFKSKCEVIPIGIKDRQDFDRKKLDFYRQKYKRYVFFVGVFRYYKGLQYLIDAVSQSNINLVLAGAGGIEKQLRQQAKGMKNVFFVGAVNDDEKFHLMKSSLAVVLPSHLRTEAFGITLLEGAMLAKPLISCEIGTGTSFINVDGQTGMVVEKANPMALKEAIIKIATDEKLATKFGEAARNRYLKLFNIKTMADSYQRLYSELISNR